MLIWYLPYSSQSDGLKSRSEREASHFTLTPHLVRPCEYSAAPSGLIAWGITEEATRLSKFRGFAARSLVSNPGHTDQPS